MKKSLILACICCMVSCFQYCSKKETVSVVTTLEPTLPSSPFNYIINYPEFIQTALTANDNTGDNVITNDGAALGRVLFYDKHLSANNTISCASCHQQKLSFEDTLVLSKGFEGGSTARNSMAILNLRFYKSGKMFWDERSLTVEKQALQPIQNLTEMGMTLAGLESKVQSLSYYPALFEKAFGSTKIDSVLIAKALAQFERSIVTYQSKYDLVKQGLDTFTTLEAQGEQVFLAPAPGVPALSCSSCHTPPMFINSAAPPFGLVDATDAGINNTGKFKSGSLRNIGTRKSLFHNGSILNVQAMLTAGGPGTGSKPIPAHSVFAEDTQRLLAFLNTLTDNTILTEQKFSDPFVVLK